MAIELVSKLPYDHPYRWDGTKFGSGKLWRPSELGASLSLWLDAEDASTITLNGSTVSQWNDKSGNARHVSQATAANQPFYNTRTLNGKKVIEFPGNQMLWSTDAVASGNPDVLMAAVIQYDTNIGADARVLQLSAGPGTSYAITGGSDGYSSRFNNGNEIYEPPSLATSLIQVGTHPSGGDYASSQMFINGTESARTSGASDASVLNIGNGVSIGAGAISSDPLGTVGRAMDGFIAEAMIVSDVTLATRQKLEGYLAWKWGLVANLPATHPYKTQPPFVIDPEAQRYLRAVEAADGEPLEEGVRLAVNDFVVGCKEDGIWDAIKASAILAGARTLGGALVPLTGAAPTNFNFVAGDYNRATGLKGDGSTKYLNSNRNNNADPQNSKHVAVYMGSAETRNATRAALASRDPVSGNGSTELLSVPTDRVVRINRTAPIIALPSAASLTGLYAGSRSNAANFIARFGSVSQTVSDTSSTPTPTTIDIFARNADNFFDGRLSFYSIGESIDLEKLDTRVSTLNSHLKFAINTGLYAGDYSEETVAYVNAGYAAGGTLE